MLQTEMRLLLIYLWLFLCVKMGFSGHIGHFGTKTAYRHVINEAIELGVLNNISARVVSGCKPVQMVAYIRHGARNPGSKDISNLNKVFTEWIREHTSFTNLKHWTPKFVTETSKEITEAGRVEHRLLAKRLSGYFPSLFEDKSLLHFISSDKNRTEESCLSFQDGLGMSQSIDRCEIRNDLMRFFAECQSYLRHVEYNPLAVAEYRNFISGPVMEHTIKKLAKRLNIPAHTLNYKALKAMYVTAGAEIASFYHSPWEQVFDDEDIKVMEYAGDLKSYWRKGYGHLINYQQACQLLVEMFKYMDEIVYQTGEPPYPTAVLHFGHAETVIPLLCLLGLFRDTDPLLATPIQHNRTYRTSHMMPFAANLVFVLYQCSNGPGQGGYGQRWYVELMHNERPVPLAIGTFCAYEDLKNFVSPWTSTCNMDKLCKHEPRVEL